jgi:hypothetical protein
MYIARIAVIYSRREEKWYGNLRVPEFLFVLNDAKSFGTHLQSSKDITCVGGCKQRNSENGILN